MSIEAGTLEDSLGRSGPTQQFLTFSLSDEVFAMDIRTVREIIQHANMTVVPLMPDFVRGVINLRGAVVPVIDLQSRFGRDNSRMGKKTCIVIFDASNQGEKQELGLMVDAVSEVIDIADHNVEPPPTFGTSIAREFLRGMGKVEGDFIPIIDTDKALSLDEMASIVERHNR
ncbi:chemotaxis protein CheW [Curvibacter sp. APW13]|uniref:chemotaxis protein CheW n=1 Tax=Curvibacter sp. APW13 TaxID=3077236 RepID=UPI0028DEE71C|nr:chemotaxis protein CheW [Curvibacter sp. APW13]MDT8990103.1 chemotaxis protein CheW [Curvibacter sp. APW13]